MALVFQVRILAAKAKFSTGCGVLAASKSWALVDQIQFLAPRPFTRFNSCHPDQSCINNGMAKVNMKETDYYKSRQHTENAKAASKRGNEVIQQNKVKRIAAYYENPKFCAQCSLAITYEKQHNKFCCKSCGAKFNNLLRHQNDYHLSADSKKKISSSVKDFYSLLSNKEKEKICQRLKRTSPAKKHPPVEITCPVCHKTLTVPYIKRNRKTCGSDDCRIYAAIGIRNYKNGRRLTIWFFNPNENKDVLLESSWEVEIAKLLISRNIAWTRPKFIKWIDTIGKTRRYFPDFYLPEVDTYLDPKNVYGMVTSKDKMAAISKKVKIVYGDLQLVKDFVNSL